MAARVFGIATALATALLAAAWISPSHVLSERSVSIDAPPSAVYALVSNLERWSAWSPWPAAGGAGRAVAGPPATAGQQLSWTGERGPASVTVTRVVPGFRLSMLLRLEDPWLGDARGTLTLRPEGTGARLTWAVLGELDFADRAAALFADPEEEVGGDLRRGLEGLRRVAERSPQTAAVRARHADAR